MLEGLAVGTEALDLTVLDAVAQKSRNLLRFPWTIDPKETPRSRTTMFLQAPGKDRVGLREEQTIIRAGHNSRIGRLINRRSVIGTKLSKIDYLTVMTGLMELLAREGLVLACRYRSGPAGLASVAFGSSYRSWRGRPDRQLLRAIAFFTNSINANRRRSEGGPQPLLGGGGP